MFGDARELGATLRRSAADRGLYLRIAVASTRTAALLVVQERSGLTVIEPGRETVTLASLPLEVLKALAQAQGTATRTRRGTRVRGAALAIPAFALLSTVRRWGVSTLGDLGALALGRAVRTVGCGWADLAAVCSWRGRGPTRAGSGRGAIRVVAGARMAGRGTRAAVLRVEPGVRPAVRAARARRCRGRGDPCVSEAGDTGNPDPHVATADSVARPPGAAHARPARSGIAPSVCRDRPGHGGRRPGAGAHPAVLVARTRAAFPGGSFDIDCPVDRFGRRGPVWFARAGRFARYGELRNAVLRPLDEARGRRRVTSSRRQQRDPLGSFDNNMVYSAQDRSGQALRQQRPRLRSGQEGEEEASTKAGQCAGDTGGRRLATGRVCPQSDVRGQIFPASCSCRIRQSQGATREHIGSIRPR